MIRKTIIAWILALSFSCSTQVVNKTPDVVVRKKVNTCSVFNSTYNDQLIDKNVFNDPDLGTKLYDFNFLDLNVREALLEVSQNIGIPIIVDENISGTVTVVIQQKSALDILDILSHVGPYDLKYSNNYIFFGSSEPKSISWYKLLYTYVYKPKHLSPSVLKQLIETNVKLSVSTDDTSYTISATATRSVIKEVVKILKLSDRPQKQIRLNLTVSEITNTENNFLGSVFGNQNNFADFSTPIILGYGDYSILTRKLAALQQTGDAEIKAQPSIVISEGQKASYSSMEKQILRNTYGSIDTKVPYLEGGIQMNIIPITSDDEVILQIQDSLSSDYDAINESSRENKISTTVRVKSGEAIMFGGMKKKRTSTKITKVPVIGDIPLVGWFFKNKEQVESTVEVVFSIQPEILCLGDTEKVPEKVPEPAM